MRRWWMFRSKWSVIHEHLSRDQSMREEIFKALIKPFAQVNQQDVSAEAIMYFKHMDV